MPEAKAAVDRALEIAVQRNDAGCHLSCLRIIGTLQLFSGHNDAGLRTLESFVAIASVADPSAVPEGETHLGCAELFVGRLDDARQRLERLYAHDRLDLNDGNSLRSFYYHSINVMIVLSHAQWLTGAPAAAEQTAARVVEYGLKADHELSLSIGLAWSCLVFLWAGRDEQCSGSSELLDEHVERHGIVTWGPVASFCRGALASRHDDSLSDGVKDLERTVAECRAIGHIARLPYYMGVLAEALTKQGRLDEAESMIGESLEMASKHNDNWSLPELLRIQAFVRAAQGRAEEQEATLLRSMALAEQLGAAAWRLRAATDLARLWQTQARAVAAEGMLQAVFEGFTEGFDTRDLVSAAKLLDELG